MTKEVVKKEESAVVNTKFTEDLGIDITDITVGRISVMQSMSQLVQSEEAKVGDIVNLLTGEKIADKQNAAEFIVVGKPFWYWIEKNGDEFVSRNAGRLPKNLPYVDGNINRMEHQSFYILLASELKDGFAMPLELSFRSSSMATARKLCSFIVKLYMMNKQAHTKVFNLTSLVSKKDKYTWYIPNISVGRDSTEEEISIANVWVNTLAASSTKVTHTDDEVISKGEVLDDTSDFAGKF